MPRTIKPPHRIEACVIDSEGQHQRIQARELVRINRTLELHQCEQGTHYRTTLLEYIFEDLSGKHVSYPGLEWIRPWIPLPKGPKK